jgi:AbrB family looped-hinge helix DNA binding protein
MTLPAAWYYYGMRATIDRAGRLVIPKPLRDSLGVLPGEVNVVREGTGIRIEPIASEEIEEDSGGRLVIGASGIPVDDDMVRALRDSDQR